MKKIYHLAENVSNESGGLRTVVINLDKYLNKNEDFSSLVITNYMEPTDNFFEFKPKKIKNWKQKLINRLQYNNFKKPEQAPTTKLETYTNWLDGINNNHENSAKQINPEIKKLTF